MLLLLQDSRLVVLLEREQELARLDEFGVVLRDASLFHLLEFLQSGLLVTIAHFTRASWMYCALRQEHYVPRTSPGPDSASSDQAWQTRQGAGPRERIVPTPS